jgi:predicted RNase H-like HicB family nuclease
MNELVDDGKVVSRAGIARRSVAMKFPVTIDRDEDGFWIVECPSIPGCISEGKTREEALKNIEDAIRLCLEVRADQGMPLTVETRQVEVVA